MLILDGNTSTAIISKQQLYAIILLLVVRHSSLTENPGLRIHQSPVRAIPF